jgi:hypothetical protein
MRQVLETKDLQAAAELGFDDDAVDDVHRSTFGHMTEDAWPHGMAAAVDVTLLHRYYERFADHAVNVAGRVISCHRGQRRHVIPRRRGKARSCSPGGNAPTVSVAAAKACGKLIVSGGMPVASTPAPISWAVAWYTANSAHISWATHSGSLLRRTGIPGPMSVL